MDTTHPLAPFDFAQGKLIKGSGQGCASHKSNGDDPPPEADGHPLALILMQSLKCKVQKVEELEIAVILNSFQDQSS